MTQMKSLSSMVDVALSIEKLRVAAKLRMGHLARQKKRDPETEELHRHLEELEKYVDGRVADLIQSHPAYPWFSLIKGVGKENIAKVVALVDVEKAPTISSLWMFAGFAPSEGRTMKRVKGEKLRYNSRLRSMCWRLAISLKKSKAVFYDYYIGEKEKYERRFLSQGYRILPTPVGRWACLNCGTSFDKKRDVTPCCANPEIERKFKKEPAGIIWLAHLDMMALRKMIKLFLACLWLVWRKAEGLPIRAPYIIGEKDHTSLISPWEMVDREPEIVKKKEAAAVKAGKASAKKR